MLLALAAGFVLQYRPLDLYQFGPYSRSVPKPEAILGYTAGEHQTTFRDQEQVLNAIARAAPDKVKIVQYGKSNQGRPLKILIISSPENMKRLDSIQKDAEALNEQDPGTDIQAIEKRMPAIVWINECIHGDEPASFEAGMWTTYNLIASKNASVAAALEKAVVILNPVYNPDGHERWAVWNNAVSTGSGRPESFEQQEPQSIYGRLNFYRFDMNRDRVAVSQQETQQEIAEVLKWHPQVYIDQHGQVSNYFFPPNPKSVNANVDRDRMEKWTDIFGRGNAKAFDQRSLTYYVRDEFDLYHTCYLDSWNALAGAIAMTYETGGTNVIAREYGQGLVGTLREGIDKHLISAIATVETAAANRTALVDEFSDYKSKTVSGEAAGKFQRVAVYSADVRPLLRLQKQLSIMGIRSAFNSEALQSMDGHDYWSDKAGKATIPAHSLIIDMAQPQGMVAKAMLEPGSDFEKQFTKEQLARYQERRGDEQYPEPEFAEFYDSTAWSLPYAHNLQAWWCESAPEFSKWDATTPAPRQLAPSTVGWALRYSDQDEALAVFDLLSLDVHVQVAPKAMKLGNDEFAPGTFLILRSINDDSSLEKLQAVAKKRGVSFVPITSGYPEEGRYGVGSGNVQVLSKPDIGVVFGDASNTSDYGAVWFLMDHEFKLPFTPLRTSALSGDLSRYTCIVFPPNGYSPSENLKSWIRKGGCAVILGSADWAIGEKSLMNLDPVKLKDRSPEPLPGAIFRAQLDPRYFLSYGYGASPEIAIHVDGGSFYKASKAGGDVVKLDADPKVKKLLSGWIWPDTEEALAGITCVHDEPMGQGHVIAFMGDPTNRAMWPGMYKMLLNAMLLGPA